MSPQWLGRDIPIDSPFNALLLQKFPKKTPRQWSGSCPFTQIQESLQIASNRSHVSYWVAGKENGYYRKVMEDLIN